MESVSNLDQLLSLRSIFKQVNQIGWTINQWEKRYPLDGLTPLHSDEVIRVYRKHAREVIELAEKLRGMV